MDEVSASLDISTSAETEMFFDDFETADNFPGATAANGELFVNKGQKIVYQGGMDWTDYAVETLSLIHISMCIRDSICADYPGH